MNETPHTQVVIYHNPRCSKSRQTLQLLHDRAIEPTIVEYLKTPPTAEELKQIVAQLGISPRALLRSREAPYQELNLANPNLSDDDIIDAMVKYPILIERPIVIHANQAALGRPPEQILEILS
jgi:arsenate reductase (glutaredoxin)